LLTARAAGVRAIGVTWGAHPRDELVPLGFDALVDSPSELIETLRR
jgi:phosphoglycolate phosphatase